jgi:cytochrome c oxidase subunit 1
MYSGFFGHPEVYIMILPAFGIVSHIMKLSLESQSSDTLQWSMQWHQFAILSFVVWAHHMFTVGMRSQVSYFSCTQQC